MTGQKKLLPDPLVRLVRGAPAANRCWRANMFTGWVAATAAKEGLVAVSPAPCKAETVDGETAAEGDTMAGAAVTAATVDGLAMAVAAWRPPRAWTCCSVCGKRKCTKTPVFSAVVNLVKSALKLIKFVRRKGAQIEDNFVNFWESSFSQIER